MKKKFTILCLLITVKIFAQTDSGSVIVHKDPRIDALIKKQVQINDETTRESRRNIPGFRIQVFASNDRTKVFTAKTRIYQQYPELKTYIIYMPPNYKLKAGNFRTQEDAQPYFDRISKLFPEGVYIIHDVIEVKPEKVADN